MSPLADVQRMRAVALQALRLRRSLDAPVADDPMADDEHQAVADAARPLLGVGVEGGAVVSDPRADVAIAQAAAALCVGPPPTVCEHARSPEPMHRLVLLGDEPRELCGHCASRTELPSAARCGWCGGPVDGDEMLRVMRLGATTLLGTACAECRQGKGAVE